MKRIFSILTAVCLLAVAGAMPAVAAPFMIPKDATAYDATYEIVVDSWDYHNWTTGESGTFQATAPYRVGPLDTKIYELEDGKYWLNQLYQHSVDKYAPPYPKFIGFRVESMVSNLRVNNPTATIYSNTFSSLDPSLKFTIWDGEEAVTVPSFSISGSVVDAGNYASEFKVSAYPDTVPFTVHLKPRSASSSPPSGIECTFYGTIHYEEKIVTVPTEFFVFVNSGEGSGKYTVGDTVTISANAPPEGQRFKQWNFFTTVTFTGGTSADSNPASFIMPSQSVPVSAVYEDIPPQSPNPPKPPKGILGTQPQYNQWYHYILFFLGFGFIWMWF